MKDRGLRTQFFRSNIAAIAGELEKFRDNNPIFNGFLISNLVDLQAVETINLIEQAFKANHVDTSIMGDWEDVQVELGLKTRDEVRVRRLSQQQKLASLFSATRQTQKVSKGFGSNQSKTKKKKSRKSSGKRKKG